MEDQSSDALAISDAARTEQSCDEQPSNEWPIDEWMIDAFIADDQRADSTTLNSVPDTTWSSASTPTDSPSSDGGVDQRLVDLEARLHEEYQIKFEELFDRISVAEEAMQVEAISILSEQLNKLNYRVTSAEALVSAMKNYFVDELTLRNELATFGDRIEQQVETQIQASVNKGVMIADVVSELDIKVSKFNDRLVGVNTRAAALEERSRETIDAVPDIVERLTEEKLRDIASERPAPTWANDNILQRLPLRAAVAVGAILIGMSAAYLSTSVAMSSDGPGLSMASGSEQTSR